MAVASIPAARSVPLTPDHILREINGVLTVNIGPAILVESASHPGDFHCVVDGQCSCIGFAGIPGKFEGRGSCRHLAIAAAALELDRQTAEPVCPCGNTWTVKVDLEVYCPTCAPRTAECEACGEVRATTRRNTNGFGQMELCDDCCGLTMVERRAALFARMA